MLAGRFLTDEEQEKELQRRAQVTASQNRHQQALDEINAQVERYRQSLVSSTKKKIYSEYLDQFNYQPEEKSNLLSQYDIEEQKPYEQRSPIHLELTNKLLSEEISNYGRPQQQIVPQGVLTSRDNRQSPVSSYVPTEQTDETGYSLLNYLKKEQGNIATGLSDARVSQAERDVSTKLASLGKEPSFKSFIPADVEVEEAKSLGNAFGGITNGIFGGLLANERDIDVANMYKSDPNLVNAVAYLQSQGRNEEAQKMVSDYELSANKVMAQTEQQQAQKLANEKPLIAFFERGKQGLTDIFNVVEQTISAVNADQSVVNKYSPELSNQLIMNTIDQEILDKASPLGGFAYQFGTSVFDMGVRAAISGGNPAAIGALSAIQSASQGMYSAIQRGGTGSQVLLSGLNQGLSEGVGDAIGAKFFKLPKGELFSAAELAAQGGKVAGETVETASKTAIGEFGKSLAQSMGVNAAQEVTTQAMQIVSDVSVMDEKSNVAQFLDNYRETNPDKTVADASLAVAGNILGQLGVAGALGALTGGVFGAPSAVMSARQVTSDKTIARAAEAVKESPTFQEYASRTAGVQSQPMTDGVPKPVTIETNAAPQKIADFVSSNETISQTLSEAKTNATEAIAQRIGVADQNTQQLSELVSLYVSDKLSGGKKAKSIIGEIAALTEGENNVTSVNNIFNATLNGTISSARSQFNQQKAAQSVASEKDLVPIAELVRVRDDISQKEVEIKNLEQQIKDDANLRMAYSDKKIRQTILGEGSAFTQEQKDIVSKIAKLKKEIATSKKIVSRHYDYENQVRSKIIEPIVNFLDAEQTKSKAGWKSALSSKIKKRMMSLQSYTRIIEDVFGSDSAITQVMRSKMEEAQTMEAHFGNKAIPTINSILKFKFNAKNNELLFDAMNLPKDEAFNLIDKAINTSEEKKANLKKAYTLLKKSYEELYVLLREELARNGMDLPAYRGNYQHFMADPSLGNPLLKALNFIGFDPVSAVSGLDNDLAGLFGGQPDIGEKGVFFGALKERSGKTKPLKDPLRAFASYVRGGAAVYARTGYVKFLDGIVSAFEAKQEQKAIKIKQMAERPLETADQGEDFVSDQLVEAEKNSFVRFLANQYLPSVAGRTNTPDWQMGTANRVANQIINMYSRGVIGANLSGAISNFGNFLQGLSGIKTQYLFKAIIAELSGEKIAKSAALQLRRNAVAVDRNVANKISFFMMEATDRITTNIIYSAKYLENLNSGMSVDEAASNANRYTMGLFGDRSIYDRPQLFNTKNAFIRLFTMFQFEVNNQWHFLFHDIPQLAKLSSGDKAKQVRALANMLTLYAIYGGLADYIFEVLFGRSFGISPTGVVRRTIKSTEEGNDLLSSSLGALFLQAGDLPMLGAALSVLTSDDQSALPIAKSVGRLPIASALPNIYNWADILTKDDGKRGDRIYKELIKGLYFLPSGGAVKRTAEGISAAADSGVYTKNADGEETLNYPVFGDLEKARAIAFGRTTTQGGRDFAKRNFTPYPADITALYRWAVVSGKIDPELVLKGYDATRGIVGDVDQSDGEGTVPLSASRNKKKAVDAVVGSQPVETLWKLYSAYGISEKVW